MTPRIDFTKEQDLLRDVVSRALHKRFTSEAVRELMSSSRGYEPRVWKELCSDVGLAGIPFPEELGGSGLGLVELCIVAEEMGRHLFCGPYLASPVMAGLALLHGDSEENENYELHRGNRLTAIASGESIASLLLDDLASPDRIGEGLLVEQGRISGSVPIALDAQHAQQLFAVAARPARTDFEIYALEREDPGLIVEPLEGIDATRKLARVHLERAKAEAICTLERATFEHLWDVWCVVLAHEMIGGAQHLLESTVEYTKVRVQFGRPIGSFQALKHRCADLLMELELARAATYHAARCVEAGSEPYAASMAKAMASDAYMSCAREAIQLRGGIGFTWEDDTHLWYKRAKSSEVLFGTPHQHRERMLRLMEEAS